MSINPHSIAFKIVAVFIFVFIVFNGLFFAFVHTQKDLELKRVERNSMELARQFIFRLHHGLSIENMEQIKLIEPQKANEFIEKSTLMMEKTRRDGNALLLYKKDSSILLAIKDKGDIYYIKNCSVETMPPSTLFAIYLFLNSVLFLAFFLIYRSIKPLKKLHRAIERFSEGDTIECRSSKKDEIAEVANAFDSAAKKIKALLESRVLFLRMVMHELKTPITKARIASEMLEEGVNRDRIIKALEKLNSQIDEFAKIERLNSKNLSLKIKTYTLSHLLQSSYKLLVSDKNIVENIDDIEVSVDLELMSIALKNLTENALKHSKDKKCHIENDGHTLLFKSRGKKIEASIDEITKPYYRVSDTQSESLGLGLYIVKEVLEAHRLKLGYEYKDEQNIFFIAF
jgi:two-component system OmpR family sensor kinase